MRITDVGGSEVYSCSNAACAMHRKQVDRDLHSTVNIFAKSLVATVVAHQHEIAVANAAAEAAVPAAAASRAADEPRL